MDPFAILTSGTRFGKPQTNKLAAASAHASNLTAARSLELPQQQNPSNRKRKRQQNIQATGSLAVPGHEDASISLFGRPMQQQQQPLQQQQQQSELPVVHTRDPDEEANVIRKTFRIKVRPAMSDAVQLDVLT